MNKKMNGAKQKQAERKWRAKEQLKRNKKKRKWNKIEYVNISIMKKKI